MKEVKSINELGEIRTICGFRNELPAKENLITFIVQHHFKCGQILDKRMRVKAAEMIKEGKHYFMYEDGYITYLIRKDKK